MAQHRSSLRQTLGLSLSFCVLLCIFVYRCVLLSCCVILSLAVYCCVLLFLVVYFCFLLYVAVSLFHITTPPQDKMMLSPLGEAKDVLYLAIVPDNDLLIQQASSFFSHLGAVYEQCRLGKHRPLSAKLRGGIMRAGRKSDELMPSEVDDEWFRDIGGWCCCWCCCGECCWCCC